jgi:transposase
MLSPHLSSFLFGNNLKLIAMKSISKGYLWEVEKVRSETICRHCHSSSTVKAGRCSTTVKEDPIRQTALWLKIHKHRIYCKACKRTFAESVDGILSRRRSTQRFRKTIAQACGKLTDIATVCRDYGVSTGFAYGVYYEQIEVKLRERGQPKWPEVLGIDEHFFRRQKGVTEFVTMFTDLKKKRAFEIAHGKNQESLFEQIKDIQGRENVKTVVIDMSGAYKSFIKKMFPNAQIIADKFHVLRVFGPQIMKAGAAIHGHRKELNTRRKLLRNRVNLDYDIRCEIDRYLKDYPELNELYRCKERLYEFYRIKGAARAVVALYKLIEQFKKSSNEAVKKIAGTLQRWRKEILCYFAHRYTNAFTERMNGTGKLVQRRAFGYKSFKNYRLRTLSACLSKTF